MVLLVAVTELLPPLFLQFLLERPYQCLTFCTSSNNYFICLILSVLKNEVALAKHKKLTPTLIGCSDETFASVLSAACTIRLRLQRKCTHAN